VNRRTKRPIGDIWLTGREPHPLRSRTHLPFVPGKRLDGCGYLQIGAPKYRDSGNLTNVLDAIDFSGFSGNAIAKFRAPTYNQLLELDVHPISLLL
jgi:hypothetical protein